MREMISALTVSVTTTLLCLCAAGEARAQRAPDRAEAGGDDGVPVVTLDRERTRRVQERAQGLGLAYDNGLWGGDEVFFAQGLRLTVGLSPWLAIRPRALFLHAEVDGAYDPAVLGALEIVGRSPVIGGLVRLYGGGGPHLGWRPPIAVDDSDPLAISYGGFFGVEFFGAPSTSFHMEVGGQGPAHAAGVGAGASIMGGGTYYF